MHHEVERIAIDVIGYLRISRIQVGDKRRAMHRSLVLNECAEHGNAKRSAQLPRQIDETGCLLGVPRIQLAVSDLIDRRKEKTKAQTTPDQSESRVLQSALSGHMSQIPHRIIKDRHTQVDENAWIDQRPPAAQKTSRHDRAKC